VLFASLVPVAVHCSQFALERDDFENGILTGYFLCIQSGIGKMCSVQTLFKKSAEGERAEPKYKEEIRRETSSHSDG
jgi:hypothetical protein